MAFTQAMLTAVDDALGSGELIVQYEGKRLQYRSVDELLKVRAAIRAELGATTDARGQTTLAEFSRD